MQNFGVKMQTFWCKQSGVKIVIYSAYSYIILELTAKGNFEKITEMNFKIHQN